MEAQILQLILDKVTSLETDVGKIKTTMATKDEINEIRSDISSLDTKIDSVQSDVRLMKQSIFELDERSIRMEQRLNVVAKQVALNTEQKVRITNIEHRVEILEADAKLMKKVLVQQ